MGPLDSFSNLRKYREAIAKAANGDAESMRFLRLRIQSTAKDMPEELVLRLSETINGFRENELSQEASEN